MISQRRHLLKGLTAGAISPLLTPFLHNLRAGDNGILPKRFLFVVKSSGLTPAELVPSDLAPSMVKPGEKESWPAQLVPTKALLDIPLNDHQLPESLKPLAGFTDQLTILQGLSGKMCRGGHSAWYGALGCYYTGNEGNPGRAASATVDGSLAAALPSIFPHVGLTLGGKVLTGVKDSVVYPGISALAADRPLPYQASPAMAYKSLFSIAATGKAAAAENHLESMLLDHMVEDINRVQRHIGSADREKLDHYLFAFDSLRDRRRKLKGLEARIRIAAPTVTDKFTSEVETDRIEAHFDIAAAALITGISNVVNVRADTLEVTYRGLGISKHVHGLGHSESVDGMTPVEARSRIRSFHLEQIARVAAKLKAVPEGDGTMLDNTLIVYLSDAAEKHHGSGIEWPFVLLGGLAPGGGNRYLQYPAYQQAGHHTIANLYNTFMHLAGKPTEQFGRLDNKLPVALQKGPLSQLLS
ncbi:MAG: DUF1552 domain-containing protein [Verrucomicrobiaceae bacterium]|nr:DUF1552 domain-containing protein [Verrucomicrobiaceae bacterium]